MSRWFLINSDLDRDYKVQSLSNKDFRRAFMAALNGEKNDFSRHIRGPYSRPLSHEWAEIRKAVFGRDDYTCTYCGVRGLKMECDHIVPVARGGGSEMGNLTTACKPCNRSKGSKLIEEWKA